MNQKMLVRNLSVLLIFWCLINDSVIAQSNNTIPLRIFSIEEMPKVDVHTHIRNPDHMDPYIEVMDNVGIDVSIVLNSISDEGFEQAQKYNGRLLFAPRRDYREDMWWTNEELDAMKQKGFAGTKLWVVYSELINETEFSKSISYQGEIGLPLIGMHVANPPAAIVNISDFEHQIANAIHVIEDNPQTTFIMAHGFWHMLEDRWLDDLDHYFETYPNLHVDLSAAAQAFGFKTLTREKLRSFMIKWKDRILFGTDAGLGHSEDRFYHYWYRILETDQKHLRGFFGGEIDIQGLALPLDVLNHIYWWNAARLIPGVEDALLKRGFAIDEPQEYAPPPGIVKVCSETEKNGNAIRLFAETDRKAEVRWSYSNIPFSKMKSERKLKADGDKRNHEAELVWENDSKKRIYLSAGDPNGHSMTTAVPVAIFSDSGDSGKKTKINSEVANYRVVANDSTGDEIHPENLKFSGLDPFREIYMRFWAKPEINFNSNLPIWRLALQPADSYPAEQFTEGFLKDGEFQSVFSIDGDVFFSEEYTLETDGWQQYTIRMNLHQNLFEVKADGETILENISRKQLAGMWGDGFDSISINTPVRNLLILTGPAAAGFDDKGEADRSAPVITSYYPQSEKREVFPGSPVLVEYRDEGLGIDTESVRVSLNGQEQPVSVMGTPGQGFIASKIPEELAGEEIHAKIVFQDLSEPANSVKKEWIFAVSDMQKTGETENIALHITPNVHATYEVPERLLIGDQISYNKEALTDGRIEPEGGSSLSWASGTGGRQPQWVEFQFDTSRDISSVNVYPVSNHGVYQTPAVLIAEAWDGSKYIPAGAAHTPEESSKITIHTPGIRTDKIRISQPPYVSRLLWLTEIEVLGKLAE